MTMSATSLAIPDHTFRDIDTPEYLDTTDRLVELLLDETNGLPATDTTAREMVQDAGDAMNGLAGKMGIDRKGKFTGQKREADRKRRSYAAAMTRGVRSILTDPHPNRSGTKRAAAERLRKVLTPHLANFSRQSNAKRSAALRLLFADCLDESVQADLRSTGLLDYYKLLVTTQETFADLLRQEGRTETDADPIEAEASSSAPVNPGTFRTFKETARAALNLAFALMAHHAQRGREPYAGLLAQCDAIISELAAMNKGRETRAQKAKAKEAAKANQSGKESRETTSANTTAAEDSTAARDPKPAAPSVGLPG